MEQVRAKLNSSSLNGERHTWAMGTSNWYCLQTWFVVDFKCKFDFDATVICYRHVRITLVHLHLHLCAQYLSLYSRSYTRWNHRSDQLEPDWNTLIQFTSHKHQIAFNLHCHCRNWMSTDGKSLLHSQHSNGTEHGSKQAVTANGVNWNSLHEFTGQTNNQTETALLCECSGTIRIKLVSYWFVLMNTKTGNRKSIGLKLFFDIYKPINDIVFHYMYDIHVLKFPFTLLIKHVISLNGRYPFLTIPIANSNDCVA